MIPPENYDKRSPNFHDWLNYWRYCNKLSMEGGGFYYNAEIEFISEIIKNKLYFASTYGEATKLLKSTHDSLYFTTDEELVYMNYYYDFGPLNIGCLYKFCCQLNSYLCSPDIKRIVYYSAGDSNKRTNAAFLIGSYAIIYLKMSPRRVHQVLAAAGGAFRNFVDASQGMSNYTLRLLDCFHAVEKARTFNFFDFADFNVMEYELYDKIQNGDMNWLLPRKFLAFIGPTDCEFMNGHPPEFYLKYFLRNDIKTVVRLNNKVYNSAVFIDAGIEHHDLFFADGTTPPKNILLRFLEISEHSPAAIAVHCKAGLGRTGSLIGAYIIKHYRMTARETIAWMRICRPGSVIGQQQGWLEKIESWLWKQGSQYRLEHFGEGDKIPRHRFGIYSKEWPVERKRLIMRAHRKAEAQGRLCVNARSDSPQKYSVPPPHRHPVHHRELSRSRKHEYEEEKAKEYHQRYAKALTNAMPDIESNNSNNVEGNINKLAKVFDVNFSNPMVIEQSDGRKKFKVLDNIGSIRRRKKLKEKIDEEDTQGDRLNEIKLKKHRALHTENNLKEISKARYRKYEEQQQQEMVDKRMQGDDGEFNMKGCEEMCFFQNAKPVPPQKSIRKRFDANRIRLSVTENS